MDKELTRVALLGAGRVGKKIVALLGNRSGIALTAIYDRDPEAPGLALAWDKGLPVVSSMEELLATAPDVIINLTGQPRVAEELTCRIPPRTRLLDGEATKLILVLADIQARAQEELRQSLRDQQILYLSGLDLTAANTLKGVLTQILERATALLETPAGSIALYDEQADEFRMAASIGLSQGFVEAARGSSIRRGGLNETILRSEHPVVIEDILNAPELANPVIAKEGIRSVLACTLKTGEHPVGILYVDDFRSRSFSTRHRSLISLFSSQAAIAIEKFRLLDQLREANNYLEGILNDSGDMIITTDTEGRIVRFNRGGEQILGYTAAEVLGKKARDLYPDPAERDRIVQQLVSAGEVRNRETTLLRKDGTPVEISLTISSLRDDEGRRIGTVGISKDITRETFLRNALEERNNELKTLNDRLEEKVIERTKELEKINEELERANRLKSRFIANMSHELRTPLNSIIGFSEILQDESYGDLNDKQRRYTENIATSGRHLLQLVNNILDLAKIEAGRLELSLQRCSLTEAIEEVAVVMRAMSERKRIELALHCDPTLPSLDADRVKIKQILYNLISNAIKFTPEGGRVDVCAQFVENTDAAIPWGSVGQRFFSIAVRDTGVGIRPEDMERIFDEFEQADSSFSRTFEGAGLGLALSKRLAELHGGHISAESTTGKGSTFTLTIPYNMERSEIEPPAAELEHLTEHFADRPPMEGDAPLILVVEDDLSTSEILTIHLTQAGYRVAHAFNGEEAIEKAVDLAPFLITLDVMLPKKDGWEVLQTLKARNDTRDIPVIVHSIIDNRELAFSLGAADYILKPVDKQGLLDRISELALHERKGRVPASILVVSADRGLKELLAAALGTEGFLVHVAAGRHDGIDLAMAARPSVILLDAGHSRETENLDLLFDLKAHTITRNIPVFLLSEGEVSVEERLELSGKIERILQKDSFQPLELITHLKDMEVSYPVRAGLMDEVTGTFNHRYFQIRLAQELLRTRRYGYSLSLLLIQIDSFGQYVKIRGEYYGNVVLRKTAELIRKSIRGSDVLVRYRSGTLAVILPNTALSSAHSLAKRFLALVDAYPFLFEEDMPKKKITASAGVSSFRADQSPEDLTRHAEGALRRAIALGGNRAEVQEHTE